MNKPTGSQRRRQRRRTKAVRLGLEEEYIRGHIPKPLRVEVYQRDGYTCRYCGVKVTTNTRVFGEPVVPVATLDHVIPRAQGGKSILDNLVTACYSCNTKKGNRTPKQADMGL